MTRLINTAALKERLDKYCSSYCENCTDTDCIECFVYEVVNKTPTVEERKKGKWEGLDKSGFFAREYKCTACESVVDMGCYTRGCDYDYCPYCGAEMEGEYEK